MSNGRLAKRQRIRPRALQGPTLDASDNFARVHQTLKATPAQAAGVADHKWSLREIAALLDSDPLPVDSVEAT
jgi:hypothetical protein